MTDRVMMFAPAPILAVPIEPPPAGPERRVHHRGDHLSRLAEAVREPAGRVQLEERK